MKEHEDGTWEDEEEEDPSEEELVELGLLEKEEEVDLVVRCPVCNLYLGGWDGNEKKYHCGQCDLDMTIEMKED